MKKLGYICLAVVLCLLMFNLKGQNSSASVRLVIVLHPVLNLTVNPEQQNTTLEYLTLKDYREGVEVSSPEQLSVSSTGPYIVKVRLSDDLYKGAAGTIADDLYLPDVRVSATPVNGGNMHLKTQSLTTMEKTLIYDDKPALYKTFDLNYKGPGGGALADYVQKSQARFSNTILFSIEVR